MPKRSTVKTALVLGGLAVGAYLLFKIAKDPVKAVAPVTKSIPESAYTYGKEHGGDIATAAWQLAWTPTNTASQFGQGIGAGIVDWFRGKR